MRPLQRVYTDFWGPFSVPTPSGARYNTHVHRRLYAVVVNLSDQDSYGALREATRVADYGRATEQREIAGDLL